MANYLLSESVRHDISSIRDFSMHHWGKKQTVKYLSELEQCLEWLADNPELGRRRNEITQGYFSFPQGRHINFYRTTAIGVEVLGIVHQSEDIDDHLAG